MTSKEILNANKLIAEFIGAKMIVENYHGINIIKFPDKSTKDLHDLKYHSSWDWLIPVIGKITSECEEPEELDNLRLHIITNDILYAWTFVVNYLSDKQ